MSDELDINACLRLLGMEIQREGELVVWFSVNLATGTRRWAAVYEYLKKFYGQTTDAGQTVPFNVLSTALGAMITDVDISSLKIGYTSIPAKRFIQLLREQLKSARYGIPGLDTKRINALAKKMPSGDDIERQKVQGDTDLDEFLFQREIANGIGSIFHLWAEEDPDEWKENFVDLLNQHSESVYRRYWDSGGPGGGADTDYIDEYLGQYWARSSIDGFSGPYKTFQEAFQDEFFRYITAATKQIWCSVLTAKELIPQLILDEGSLSPGHTVEINDKSYEVSEDFHLIPVRPEGDEYNTAI